MRWERGRRLREYADALATAGQCVSADPSCRSIDDDVAWIRHAADWLDPVVVARWPDVDGAGGATRLPASGKCLDVIPHRPIFTGHCIGFDRSDPDWKIDSCFGSQQISTFKR